MLSDKLRAKQDFVERRDRLERCYAAMVEDYAPNRAADQFSARLNSLLALHAEIVQAPLLHTLQSAAEVGLSHAQITPAAVPMPDGKVQPQPVTLGEQPSPNTGHVDLEADAAERERDIRRRMGQRDSNDE